MNPDLENTISSIKTKDRELYIQIFIVFLIPIVLLDLGIIPLQYRVWVMGILVATLVSILIAEKWTWNMLGLKTNTFKKYLLPYTIFTIIGVAGVIIFGEKTGQEEITKWWTYHHFIYGFFLVSLLQEIAYRAYLIPALGKLVSSPLRIVLINTLLFTFLHTIFPNPVLGLPLAFVGGLGFSLMYLRFPNLPLIVFSHAILNFVIVLYGFFVIPGITH